MQHYGTATRLLDWSECFAVALYFAITSKDKTHPVIWLLNPFTLACRARGSNDKSIGDFHIDKEMDYHERFLKKKNWPFKYAMPFYAPTPNERIHAQRGFFTVHGNDERSIHETAEKHIRSVSIPDTIHAEALQFLRLAGIDHDFLFPDHEGWLKKIEEDYFYH